MRNVEKLDLCGREELVIFLFIPHTTCGENLLRDRLKTNNRIQKKNIELCMVFPHPLIIFKSWRCIVLFSIYSLIICVMLIFFRFLFEWYNQQNFNLYWYHYFPPISFHFIENMRFAILYTVIYNMRNRETAKPRMKNVFWKIV